MLTLRQRRLLLYLVGIAAFILLNSKPQPAQAHGYIIRTLPQDQAVLERSPGRIQVWFSEGIEAKFSTISVTNEAGETIPVTEVGLSPTNSAQLTARLPNDLPDGTYIVRIRAAFATDGHVLSQTLVFWIGAKTGAAAAEGISGRDAIPLEVIWRSMQLPAVSVLFGLLLLYQVVLIPAWGNPRYKAGLLAPRVLNRLSLIIWIALAVALISTAIAILQQTMTLFAADMNSVLRDNLWSIVLNETQIGGALKARLLLISLSALVHGGAAYIASRAPDFVRPLWLVNLFVMTVALGTLSITSHAAGATLWNIGATLVDWLHFCANSAWIGGLIGLAVAIPAALQPLNDNSRGIALTAVLRRFSPVGVITVSLLIVTGIFSAAIQIQTAPDLTSSSYGQTLIAKVLLVVPLLLLGLYHQRIVAGERIAAALRRMLGSLRLEALLGVPVLIAAALLSSTPPPIPPVTTSADVQSVEVADLSVQLIVDPDAVGANAYEVRIRKAGAPLSDAQVWLRLVLPSLDRRSALLKLEDAGGGVYIGAGDELSRAGEWLALVDVATGGVMQRAAFQRNVSEVGAIVGARQPDLLNWLALFALIAVLTWWLGLAAWRRLKRMKFQRESVIIGVVVSALSLVLIVGGAWLVGLSISRVDQLRNPPPSIVNAVLPDQQSVERGRQLYSQCSDCPPADATFLKRLETLKDVDIFEYTQRGESGLPMLTLDDTDRWNLINYLRSASFVESVSAATS
ncbi:MAG: CopD family protein [Anaerolineae bacterium]|nr:CopD family protein [Anaerolineae bacterium]